MEQSNAAAVAEAPSGAPDFELTEWEREILDTLPPGDGLTDRDLRVDYLLEQVQKERGKIARADDFASRRVAMIEADRQEKVDMAERRIAWLEGQVRLNLPMDAERFQREYGKKSQKLPHGTVGFRLHQPTVQIDDQELAVSFAEKHGLEIKKSVNKTPLLNYVKETGDVPNPAECGFDFVDGYDSFFIRAGG